MYTKAPEFIVNLLNRHAKLLASGDGTVRSFAIAPETDQHTSAEKQEISRNVRRTAALRDARDWWLSAEPADDFHCFRQLHLLLSYLDELHSNEVQQAWELADGWLITGRRWWNVRARYLGNRKAPLDRPIGLGVFPHLQYVSKPLTFHHQNGILRNAAQDGRLRIGLCCLRGSALTTFAPTRLRNRTKSAYGFRSSGIAIRAKAGEQESQYIDELAQCVRWARDERVHVLCFPELCVCSKGRLALLTELRADAGCLGLVAAGSFHVPIDGSNWVNSSPYWVIGDDGQVLELGTFEKTDPFTLTVEAAQTIDALSETCAAARACGCYDITEDIVPGDSIHVIQTDLGRFGIAICKDVLSAYSNSARLMERYAGSVDHLLILSMNAAEDAGFAATAKNLLRTTAMASFYVNSAQVVAADKSSNVDLVFWQTTDSGPVRWVRDNTPNDGRVIADFELPAELRGLW